MSLVQRRSLGADESRDAVAQVLGGAPLVPAQWYALAPCAALRVPEGRLMARVLAEAKDDYLRYRGVCSLRARRRVAEVRAWFASDDTAWPFSFVNICHVLELDPEATRRSVVTAAIPSPRRHHIAGARHRVGETRRPQACP